MNNSPKQADEGVQSRSQTLLAVDQLGHHSDPDSVARGESKGVVGAC
jgi:hypothetical protein